MGEEILAAGPLVERSTSKKMVLEGTVNKKLEVDQLIVKSSGVDNLWWGSCSDGSLFFCFSSLAICGT